jgi:hypothetical protein
VSISIESGFRVKHNDPALLQKQLKKLQAKFTLEALKELSACLPQQYPIDKIDREYWEGRTKQIYYDRLVADVCVFFQPHQILGICYIYNRAWEKKFRAQKWYADYHYQNRSDPDPKVSEDEWEQRRLDWEFLYIPGKDGFLFQLVRLEDLTPYDVQMWRATQ